MPKRTDHYATRSSISLPRGLLKDLDEMIRRKGVANRSLAIADMVRDSLVEHRQHSDDREIVGTITLVFDHHKRDLQSLMTDVQHDHHHVIIATMHVHLDHDNCLEMIAVRGKASMVRKIADALIALKGIKHGKLTVTSTGKDLGG